MGRCNRTSPTLRGGGGQEGRRLNKLPISVRWRGHPQRRCMLAASAPLRQPEWAQRLICPGQPLTHDAEGIHIARLLECVVHEALGGRVGNRAQRAGRAAAAAAGVGGAGLDGRATGRTAASTQAPWGATYGRHAATNSPTPVLPVLPPIHPSWCTHMVCVPSKSSGRLSPKSDTWRQWQYVTSEQQDADGVMEGVPGPAGCWLHRLFHTAATPAWQLTVQQAASVWVGAATDEAGRARQGAHGTPATPRP